VQVPLQPPALAQAEHALRVDDQPHRCKRSWGVGVARPAAPIPCATEPLPMTVDSYRFGAVGHRLARQALRKAGHVGEEFKVVTR
jgi:hypothetical protein